jgi:hypothetical protein
MRLRAPAVAPPVSVRPQSPLSQAEPPALPAEPDDHGRPEKRKKKGKKHRNDKARGGFSAARVRVIVGAGLGMLALATVVVILLLRGRGGAGDGGGSDRYVIVNAPVPPLADEPPPKQPAAQPPRPDPKPERQRKRFPEKQPPPPPPKAQQPWAAQPDPPAEPPPVLAENFGHNLSGFPLFAALGGPFAIDVPVVYGRQGFGERFVNGKRTVIESPQPPIPVLDLRTGKPAGEFDWKASVWLGGILSPDGLYVVGPDPKPNSPATQKDGLLFVWKRGAKEPVDRIPLNFAVPWMDFVAPDRLAVQTFNSKPVLQVWDVSEGKLLQTIALPEQDFPKQDAAPYLSPAPKLFFFPRPFHGAVSPGRKYVALGGRSGIVLASLAEGKLVGELPLPGPRSRVDYQGLGFSPDGADLFAVVNPHVLKSWAMKDGSPQVEVTVPELLCGAPLPGPEPGTVILPFLANLPAWDRATLWRPLQREPGKLLDLASGAELLRLDFMAARWAGPGRLLAFGGLKPAPHVPLPPGAAGLLPKKDTTPPDAYAKAVEKVRANPQWQAVYTVAFDQKQVRDRAGPALALLARRPPARPADRSAVKAVKPEPPAAWAVPAAGKPAPPAATLLPHWPDAFADASAAAITFTFQNKPQARWEVHWQRLDLATGQPLGQPLALWPWATQPGKGGPAPKNVLAALTTDGKRLALRDHDDPSRVDVWDDGGTRLLGLVPGKNGGAIDWLGWSGDGRLLTLAGGTLTAWEVPAGRAVYEVEGDYQGPLHLAPGQGWLAAAAADHVDLLDAATGRCRAEGKAADWGPCALAPDGRTLVRTRRGDPLDRKTSPSATGARRTSGT